MKVIENKGNYIYVKYDEPYELKKLIALMKEAMAICVDEGSQKLLVNLLDMPGKIKTLDRLEMGIQGALIFRHHFKVAVVYRKEELNLFAEDVAVNRGLNTRVFSDMDTAMEWLMEK